MPHLLAKVAKTALLAAAGTTAVVLVRSARDRARAVQLSGVTPPEPVSRPTSSSATAPTTPPGTSSGRSSGTSSGPTPASIAKNVPHQRPSAAEPPAASPPAPDDVPGGKLPPRR